MKAQQARALRLLHVEDNAGDVRLVAEALKETGRAHEIVAMPDGVEALHYLYRRGPYTDAPLPDLILLDINLPKKSGLELLAEIKSDADLKHLPVVVFTSSSAPRDVARAYDLHASCYIAKPAELDELFRVVGMIEKFWLNAAELPGPSGPCRGGAAGLAGLSGKSSEMA
jgi:CheY-like chemotaxis protein